MQEQLDTTEDIRRKLLSRISQKNKTEFGQFMTPSSVARFMANLFPPSTLQVCRLLDAGAGIGSLSCAFLDRWKSGGFQFKSVEATAYEIDEMLLKHLKKHLMAYKDTNTKIIAGDFITLSTNNICQSQRYTHTILNPPYKKISSDSEHRLALRTVGIETVNLYSAFLALAIRQAEKGGHIVAIIPRSFCNGPYYRKFREFMLEQAAIHHLHLFRSRSQTFKDDSVLQENVIVHLERGGKQGSVTTTVSTDDSFEDIVSHQYPFDRIVNPHNPERFIHVPESPVKSLVEESSFVCHSLKDLAIGVSTGPVVDFRVKEYLRAMPAKGCVPLIYPTHLKDHKTRWPIRYSKKPNAIIQNQVTKKWLYPNGFYCLVRRFSSKEEKRRIVASVIEPADFSKYSELGFENHINVFHDKKQGLPEFLARGLTVFLNSSAVDQYFRCFNGHTQVNATDLKSLYYPSRDSLIELGYWAIKKNIATQGAIDNQLRNLLSE